MSKKVITISNKEYNEQLKRGKTAYYVTVCNKFNKQLEKIKIPKKLKQFHPIPVRYQLANWYFYELLY